MPSPIGRGFEKGARGFYGNRRGGHRGHRPEPVDPDLRVETDRDHRVGAIVNSRKTNVGPLIRQRQGPASIYNETKFGRQRPKPAFGCKPSRDLPTDSTDVKRLVRIDSRERADHEVAYRLRFWRGVENPQVCDHVVQFRQRPFADAADLQIGTPRHVDMAVAETASRLSEHDQFVQGELSASRTHPHDKSITA